MDGVAKNDGPSRVALSHTLCYKQGQTYLRKRDRNPLLPKTWHAHTTTGEAHGTTKSIHLVREIVTAGSALTPSRRSACSPRVQHGTSLKPAQHKSGANGTLARPRLPQIQGTLTTTTHATPQHWYKLLMRRAALNVTRGIPKV